MQGDPPIKTAKPDFAKSRLVEARALGDIQPTGVQSPRRFAYRPDPGAPAISVMEPFPPVRRESLRCQQRAVPPLIGPWNGYRDIVQQHRRPGTVGTLTGMLAHAGRSGDPGPNGRAVCSRVAIERRDPTPPVRTDPTGSRPGHRLGGCLTRHERWSHPIVAHAVPAPSGPKPPLSCPGGGRSNPGDVLDDLSVWDPVLARRFRALLLWADAASPRLLAATMAHGLESVGGLMREAWNHGA